MSGEWISPLNRSTAHINGTRIWALILFNVWVKNRRSNLTSINYFFCPKHQRSRSMLDPSLVNLNPNLKRTNSNVQVQPLYQKKTPQQRILSQNHSRYSKFYRNFSYIIILEFHIFRSRIVIYNWCFFSLRSISLLDEQKLQTSAIRLEDLSSRKILHMSTSQLQQMIRSVPDGAAGSSHHKRSSSTPYEGFVLWNFEYYSEFIWKSFNKNWNICTTYIKVGCSFFKFVSMPCFQMDASCFVH